MPKKSPTIVDNTRPTATAVGGTAIGTGVKFRTATANNHAIVTPIKPPVADSVQDSTRN